MQVRGLGENEKDLRISTTVTITTKDSLAKACLVVMVKCCFKDVSSVANTL